MQSMCKGYMCDRSTAGASMSVPDDDDTYQNSYLGLKSFAGTATSTDQTWTQLSQDKQGWEDGDSRWNEKPESTSEETEAHDATTYAYF